MAHKESIPAGLAAALLWAPLGTGSPNPLAPAPPQEVAAQADPVAPPPVRDSLLQVDEADDAIWVLSWDLRNSLVPADKSRRDTLRRPRGPAACTAKEYLITGMLSQEGGFAIMLQETGIAIRAQ